MTTVDLTDRQRECLALIVGHIRRYGQSPTIRELMAMTGCASPNTIAGNTKALERKGFLTVRPWAHRGLEVFGLEVRVDYADTAAGHRLAQVLGHEEDRP